MIDQDTVPATMLQAVEMLDASLSPEAREALQRLEMSHHGVGQYLRNNWSLWEWDTPLKNDCIATYKIAHADDMSGLLIAWTMARVRGQDFDPIAYCERFHEHWRREGMTSIEAGTPDNL